MARYARVVTMLGVGSMARPAAMLVVVAELRTGARLPVACIVGMYGLARPITGGVVLPVTPLMT